VVADSIGHLAVTMAVVCWRASSSRAEGVDSSVRGLGEVEGCGEESEQGCGLL
jgi:hypothetical protein